MKWIRERDLLIAQTMAFVQSVTGKKPDAETRVVGSALATSYESDEAAQSAEMPFEAIRVALETVNPPAEPRKEAQIPRTAAASDIRSEIQSRVANFRAHQERFSREREEYCTTTLAKARAAIESASVSRPGPLRK
jgi:hypothetical protein